MILTSFNRELERKLAAGALEFAVDKFHAAQLSGSIDAQLEAGRLLFTAAVQTHPFITS